MNLSGLEKHPGFQLTAPLSPVRAMYAIVFGDIFMKMCIACGHTRLYGSVNAMHEKWKKVVRNFVSHGYPSRRRFNRLCREIIEDFDNHIELLDVKKPRVGVVGEILVKFLPAANNYLVELLESKELKRLFHLLTSCSIASTTRTSK